MNNHDDGDKNIQLQIIDFEDALMVGSSVNKDLAEVYSNDERYPIKRGINCRAIIAKVEFNNFFFDSIEAWLITKEEKEFRRFMINNKLTITYYD